MCYCCINENIILTLLQKKSNKENEQNEEEEEEKKTEDILDSVKEDDVQNSG